MKNISLVIIIYSVFMFFSETLSFSAYDPDLFARERHQRSRRKLTEGSFELFMRRGLILDFYGLITQYGYPAEEHNITTADGYKIHIHRIPGTPTQPEPDGKPAVYIQHGLLASSDCFVLMGPGIDLAYDLADAGYDVWFGNARGTTYGRSHVSLSPDEDADFWKYSYHEIAIYDVAGGIDYVLQLTNQKSLIYIGHSMGTTVSYILLSTRPEYNEKIKLAISLSPTALWFTRPDGFLPLALRNLNLITNAFKRAKVYEVLPLTSFNTFLAKTICPPSGSFAPLCANIYHTAFGYSPEHYNSSVLSYVIGYLPAGTSIQTVTHYAQNIISVEFLKYDHGEKENMKLYGQPNPPSYEWDKITAPFALFYGRGDTLSPPENSIEVGKRLKNLVTSEYVPDENFNHVDFLLAPRLKELLNDRILEIMGKFSNGNSI